MISTLPTEAKSSHPLTRFVTKEAIALLLNLNFTDIYRIDCWRYVIHVVGKGVSKFVSYADLPPVLGVELPTKQDFVRWRKRWQKSKKLVPAFWLKFYTQKFRQACSIAELSNWGQIVDTIKLMLSSAAVQELRNVYITVKNSLLPNFKSVA